MCTSEISKKIENTEENEQDIGDPDDEAKPGPVLADPGLHHPLVEVPLKLKHVRVGAELLLRDGLEGGGGEYFDGGA